VLVDGTPASCVQIGLYHYFHDRGPVDLVVSGPNFGRNSTAVFSLSSGTLGGALEAAVCKRRAIALSYAFFSKERPGLPDTARDPEIIATASKLSVQLIDHLYKNWGSDVDLYSINVPLVEGVDSRKIMWTNMLQNYWSHGSCFKEVEDEDGTADEEEERIREREGAPSDTPEENVTRHKHKHFKWAPRFVDVYKSVEEAGPGNDGWAVKEHYTRSDLSSYVNKNQTKKKQCDSIKSEFHACSGANRRRAEVVSVSIALGALDHVRPIQRSLPPDFQNAF